LAAALGLGGIGVRSMLGVPVTAVLAIGSPVVLVASVLQVRGRVSPLPERRAQVPTRWLQWRSRASTATAFGLVIGAGAFTRLRHATAWVLALALVAAPTIWAAVACGAIYGAVRGLPLLITWTLDVTARQRPAWERVGQAGAPLSLVLSPIALATYALLLVLSARG
jgi:hypothetical protein